jgi:hypothetical protein
MIVSRKSNPRLGNDNLFKVSGLLDAQGGFEVVVKGLEEGRKYFYRTYAINAEGVGYGLVNDFVTMGHANVPNWANAQQGTAPGWWNSPWFGSFFVNERNAWVMHAQLGWLYPIESPVQGIWLWKKGMGWLWTDAQYFPFLYQNDSAGWLYYYGTKQDRSLFYHYRNERWIVETKGTK